MKKVKQETKSSAKPILHCQCYYLPRCYFPCNNQNLYEIYSILQLFKSNRIILVTFEDRDMPGSFTFCIGSK